ncbi:ubiquinol-cytochrome c reductase iron-sulfur subunit [Legionella maioricensis]|uniref:Ubiquinol-cytochrome c reductase iron-sulfur subunit n=1 Tax=Legionella maioricensis TaxID=2896528 RepID=A0A9X2D2S0_9GAMM|nr:ubiquinol-cytochrome c reductase iron-sulfur subunit [Legionella maioricensis]MCL9685188.1 ubiquinol-cytochrome c reductase iron-sulfur subunit [Legionella maioricensis]MCL9688405.1 ubiquinol-cytochrome c reductase iron-sulfur subunit [Legionella maioricensis]
MVDEITNLNQEVDKDKEKPLDEERRRFLLASTSVLAAVGAACALTPFVSSWLPSAKTRAAAAPVQVDLSKMEPGEQVVVAWRGKPVWIIRRTQEMIQHLTDNESLLRDPLSLVEQQPEYARNEFRSINPEYLVLIGICTHLGCSPKYKPVPGELGSGWQGGFFCPCHGSTFDLAGRVFKGVPAPINLEVPPHHFINEHTLVIGEDTNEG